MQASPIYLVACLHCLMLGPCICGASPTNAMCLLCTCFDTSLDIHRVDICCMHIQLGSGCMCLQGHYAMCTNVQCVPDVLQLTVAKEIIAKDGAGGLYKGLSAGLLRQATYTTARLGIFQIFSDLLKTRNQGKVWSHHLVNTLRALC